MNCPKCGQVYIKVTRQSVAQIGEKYTVYWSICKWMTYVEVHNSGMHWLGVDTKCLECFTILEG